LDRLPYLWRKKAGSATFFHSCPCTCVAFVI